MCASDTDRPVDDRQVNDRQVNDRQVNDRQVNDRRSTTPTVILRWVWNAWVRAGCILARSYLSTCPEVSNVSYALREQNLRRAENICHARASNQPLDPKVCGGDVSKGKGNCRVRLRNDWIAQPASF